MGDFPNRDQDLFIPNGNFADDSLWNFGPLQWTWVPSHARFFQPGGVSNFLGQFNIPFVPGNEYTIHFTLSDTSFTNAPAGGLKIFAGSSSQGLFFTDDDHEITIMSTDLTEGCGFVPFNTVAGDHCNVDDVFLTRLGNRIIDVLEVGVAPRPRIDLSTAVATDFMQVIACPFDKTNVLVGFNI